jgi:hypothetical protein
MTATTAIVTTKRLELREFSHDYASPNDVLRSPGPRRIAPAKRRSHPTRRSTRSSSRATPSIGSYVGATALAIAAPRIAAFGYLVIAVISVLCARGDEPAAAAPA